MQSSITGNALNSFNEERDIARGVINGSEPNPMTDVPDAIFFTNSSYGDVGQQTAYEVLLNDDKGPVSRGNWGYFEGTLGRFYYYRNNARTQYPAAIPLPPHSTPTPTPAR